MTHLSRVALLGLTAATMSYAISDWSHVAEARGVPQPLWQDGRAATAIADDAPFQMDTFAKLADELSPSVVSITTKREAGGEQAHPFFNFFGAPPGGGMGRGLGTGFIIHPDGFVLTNHHVIDDATDIEVTLVNGNRYGAEVVGSWQPLDVALLRVEATEPLTAAALGNSDNVTIGDWVLAIGNAMGLSHTVTAGIVSAKGRRDVQPGARSMISNFIQTDASINPGNSGGPLISSRGEVIGMNTAINAAAQGIGFAVPINMIKTVLPQLATGGVQRSFLGVKIGPVANDDPTNTANSRPKGALIREVIRGLPAARAGVKAGDIVVSFNGKSLDHWEDLSWFASTAGAGTTVTLGVLRNQKPRTIEVKLTTYEQAQARAETTPGKREATTSSAGLSVSDIAPRLRRQLRLSAAQGVLVTEVEPSSAASEAGVEAGDVVLKVNYTPVNSGITSFERLIRRATSRGLVSLHLLRGKRELFVAFSP